MVDLTVRPQPWTAEQIDSDRSWIQHLSPQAVEDFDQALAHAKRLDKSIYELTEDDFPLRGAGKEELLEAYASTQRGWGLCLLKGFPVRRWSEDDTRLAYWCMGLHVGTVRTQNAASEVICDVRDSGNQNYQGKGGRGYNTNKSLDFHVDFCDVVSLLCRRTARAGGTSLIVSSQAVVAEIEKTYPHLVPALYEPLYYSLQGAHAPGASPYYACPLLGEKDGIRAFRTNRKNIVAAQRDFPEVPRLTDLQKELIDVLDTFWTDSRFCFSMKLDEGDMQLVNNYVVVHSRTDFEDFDDPDEKRHLLRLWMCLPQAQALPDSWREAFTDTRAGAVRGGNRGSNITSEFLDYERSQAAKRGMPNVFS